MKTLRISAAQTPDFRDDLHAALDHLGAAAARAHQDGAALIVFPECFLQGYATEPQDARRLAIDLNSRDFQNMLARFPASDLTLVVGLIEEEAGQLFNTAVVIRQRALLGRYRKRFLLTCEGAFSPGAESPTFTVGDLRFGIAICHDTNFSDATQALARAGASLVLCPANNMLPEGAALAFRHRHNQVRAERCREAPLWMVSADVTGRRNGRVSWGPTAVISPGGEVVAALPLDRPGMLTFDLPLQ